MKFERIFHDVDQSEQEWLDLRLGFVTASNFACIMANNGKAFGEPAKKYAMRVALESETKQSVETYSNAFMDRGIELEPLARSQYEDDNMVQVSNGGFMEFGTFGASSDGLVGDDGMIEIKSVIYSTHYERFIKGGADPKYKYQMQGQMWVYDRKYCDFVSFCPEFPKRKNLYVFRVDRDEEMIEQMRERLDEFVKLVDEYKEKIK